jgi:hypothetical protein
MWIGKGGSRHPHSERLAAISIPLAKLCVSGNHLRSANGGCPVTPANGGCPCVRKARERRK